MKVPKNEQAFVPEDKLSGYLLSRSHYSGREKSRIFRAIGFDEGNLELLEHALLDVIQANELLQVVEFEYGFKYVVDGRIEGRGGKGAYFRTVWIVKRAGDSPRFVTAYPLEK